MIKAIEIISMEPYRGPFSSKWAYFRRNRKILERAGFIATKARFDEAGNCLICGEAGECPGWHIKGETRGK